MNEASPDTEGPTNTTRHRKKFSRLGDLAYGICASQTLYDFVVKENMSGTNESFKVTWCFR